jgi:hypothetical protein
MPNLRRILHAWRLSKRRVSHRRRARENDQRSLRPSEQGRANTYKSGKWGHDPQASHWEEAGFFALVSPTYYSAAGT